ncbi:diacylglycerol/lipid kinase family protein [Citricoccus sp. NR2]|uniref:diacylglycerol/lipid kinase family protein n=1 Tax=Citricoccus sp. NR2 TaxID=3004095 RepID=UPI0022DDC201|nr:diacylglycerol kinase family protein [Citricoccus sp. NR2]WBL19736.1 diacylglycerol kinase family protein [Citricoccus sp. NR2]
MSAEMILAVVALSLILLLLVTVIVLSVQLRRQAHLVHRLVEGLDSVSLQVQTISSVPSVARSLDPAQKVALILNPVKPHAAETRHQVEVTARVAGMPPVMVYETTETDPGTAMAEQALADGATVVLAAGGDGTVRRVAEVLAGTDASLGILPLGTGNLLARNLHLPIADMEQCIAIALQGHHRAIDTVSIRLTNQDGSVQRTAFTVIAGVGYDAEIMDTTNDTLKQHAGWLAYGEAGMRQLAGKRKEISVSLDGGPLQRYQVRSVMVANCGLLTGGINFVPHAVIDDGLLDVVLLSPRHVVDWLRIAGKTLLKSRRKLPVLESHQATQCKIVLHEPMTSQLDGDASGQVREISARVQPESLRVQVPERPNSSVTQA